MGKSDVVRRGMEYNLQPTDLQVKEKPLQIGGFVSFFDLKGGNTLIDSIKPAFDHRDAIVLRIYEAGGSFSTSYLQVPQGIQKAFCCNMLEEDPKEMKIEGDKIKLTFHPFEIKTLMLKLSD